MSQSNHKIKAAKTTDAGKVVTGNHQSYRIHAESEREKNEWMRRVNASIASNPFIELLQRRRQRVSNKGPIMLWILPNPHYSSVCAQLFCFASQDILFILFFNMHNCHHHFLPSCVFSMWNVNCRDVIIIITLNTLLKYIFINTWRVPRSENTWYY